ncbi:hypothetical protein K469DRAFT_805290 [Zopfia rhizophila CBS 207.26]|uniref:Protein kinase domain-containing protein n=1 Tax=Zopfia rhizophila CBS 207.26 TaxID=1314779 RepID=A0A6A6EIR4_9PEZI|nr:hypothetical protein K469DRAFT_805290 [Zopfia rhizophila CBS 207.26]
MDRPTLSLPSHLRHLPESSRPQPPVSDRSTLPLPPELLQIKSSHLSDTQPRRANDKYDIQSPIQYLSDFPKGANFKTQDLVWKASFPVTGRGRTYEMRRYSEGNRKDVDVHDHWRDSQAIKCLRVSLTENDESANSYRYRSLIQELRILRHHPLSKHPNLLRVNGIGWEPNEDDIATFLPFVQAEFATLGTLNTFLSSWQIPYVNQKRRLILDVTEGLSGLHECSVVHGDVKSENVLVLMSEDRNYPFLAKLSDFGFSIDTSSTDESCGHLVGYTPLWAAPEATSRLQYSAMFLTDVYSFGFVIWSIVADGQSLFDDLRDLPQDPQGRFEAFNSLKVSDQLLASNIRQILCANERESDVDYAETFEFVHYTLKLNPSERNLQCIIANFNPTIILPYYRSRLGYQIQKQLERVALSDQPQTNARSGAAFALFNQHFLGAKQDEAISRAVPWLKLSAEHGYPVAMALQFAPKIPSSRQCLPSKRRRVWRYSSALGRNDRIYTACSTLPGGNRIDINIRNARGETPLLLTCQSGHTVVVDILLDLGADPTVSNTYNENCLHWLISFDDDAVSEYAWKFLKLGVDLHQSATLDESFRGSHRFTHLSRAVRAWEDMPPLFHINYRYDYSTVGETLRILVAAGAKINNAPTDIFGLAVSRRNYLATNFIISNGYDRLECRFPQLRSGKGSALTALHLAVFGQDFNTIDVLLRHGANVNAEMNWYDDSALSILQICARLLLNTFEIASRLIEAGAEVNYVASQDHYIEAALSRALILNDFGFADFLLANGASASYVPPFWPPISCIRSVIVNTDQGKWLYRALEFLISHPKAELPFWSCEELRQSIFHSIFSRTETRLKFIDPAGLQALFRLLHQQFPNVEMLGIPNMFGATALHCAVYYANVTGVKLLLEAGCDRQYRATPLDEDYQRFAREGLERQNGNVGSDVAFNDEDYKEVVEEIKTGLLPPYAGKSIVEIAQADMFFDIPSFV